MTAPAQLRSFVDRIERVQAEIDGLNTDKRDLYAEAKSAGFDVKALKIVIGRRAKDVDALSELDAIVETYEAALGTEPATRAPARAREPSSPPPRISEPLPTPFEYPELPGELDRNIHRSSGVGS